MLGLGQICFFLCVCKQFKYEEQRFVGDHAEQVRHSLEVVNKKSRGSSTGKQRSYLK